MEYGSTGGMKVRSSILPTRTNMIKKFSIYLFSVSFR